MATIKKYNGSTWENTTARKYETKSEIITPPTTIYTDGTAITNYTISGNTVQSGTPTPSNPVPVVGVGELEITGEHTGEYKIPISSGGVTTNIYLGSTQTVRQVKKVVFTGNEQFTNTQIEGGYRATISLQDYIKADAKRLSLCSHFPYRPNWAVVPGFVPNGALNALFFMSLYSDFAAYCAQQYANGTPVTVYYVPETPQTATVNEPLMKIGNYADEVSGISIPTIAGANTLSVDTTLQPSEVTVNYKGWHPVQSVHETEVGNNLFDYTTMATSAENSYLNPDGTIGTSNDWNISDYIPCDGTMFAIGTIGGNTPAFCLYDGNKQYITGKSYNTGGASSKQAVNITSQSTAKYIRFSYCKASGVSYDNLSAIMLNKGISLLPYEPYGTHWT